MGELYLMLLSEASSASGIVRLVYLSEAHRPTRRKLRQKPERLLRRLIYNKYYVDEIYDAMFVNRAKDLGARAGRVRP